MITNSVADFDYHLPLEYIAQTPMVPRENANLMALDRKTETITYHRVIDLPSFFHAGDIVVVNNTKVFHARLHGELHGSRVELFLVRPELHNHWLALGKPGKKFHIHDTIRIASDFAATVEEKYADGTISVSFPNPPGEVIRKANMYGEVPVPPYIKTIPNDRDYQTSYAKVVGSVAAPTAGFHLTKRIRDELVKKGVTIEEITLHVGIGTFMPIKSETLAGHSMHSEWAHISAEVADHINKAKKEGQRVIAIGTTSVRTLEGIARLNHGKLKEFTGDIDLFIKPGFEFQIVDAMLTNFHLPKSTLIVLVSAFACPSETASSDAGRRAGREKILQAYRRAIDHHFRFYSFGDAMLIY